VSYEMVRKGVDKLKPQQVLRRGVPSRSGGVYPLVIPW
jgi:hypothetical protein